MLAMSQGHSESVCFYMYLDTISDTGMNMSRRLK